jgi:hypothetical protein
LNGSFGVAAFYFAIVARLTTLYRLAEAPLLYALVDGQHQRLGVGVLFLAQEVLPLLADSQALAEERFGLGDLVQ